MAVKERKRRYPGVQPKPFKFDPNPLYACEVTPHPTDPKRSVVKTWMAFDPKYGPESQQQIDWHVNHGTPGAETWKVGEPVKVSRTAD